MVFHYNTQLVQLVAAVGVVFHYNTQLVQLMAAVGCGISLQHSHCVQLVAVVGL